MKEKNYNKYQFVDKKLTDDVIELLLKEKQQEIEEEVKKDIVSSYKHKYNYKTFSVNNIYAYDNFSRCNGDMNNPNKLSNYERIAYRDNRLVIPKLLMQALGTKKAIYLAELARLSMYKPVNDYGFFLYSRDEIKNDIGLTARQQDAICKELNELGIINTVTFRKQQRKFYRFNDDFMVDFYWSLYKKTIGRIKYRD